MPVLTALSDMKRMVALAAAVSVNENTTALLRLPHEQHCRSPGTQPWARRILEQEFHKRALVVYTRNLSTSGLQQGLVCPKSKRNVNR